MSHLHTPEVQAKRAAARKAQVLNTPSTTRPGSERTNLRVGDRVRIARLMASSGTFSRYSGREGWVASVHREEFPSGVRYVEIGITWQAPSKRHPSADTWFRADEMMKL